MSGKCESATCPVPPSLPTLVTAAKTCEMILSASLAMEQSIGTLRLAYELINKHNNESW